MFWIRTAGIGLLLVTIFAGYFVYSNAQGKGNFPFQLGLDLVGGTQLVYTADTSTLTNEAEIQRAMNVLRDVIERRVNIFGVSEPLVQVEKGTSIAGNGEYRLLVELPGVTDVEAAVRQIGQTPLLEFKLGTLIATTTSSTTALGYVDTGLTGRYLERASLQFGDASGTGLTNKPSISLLFNEEGAALFAKITSEHVGEQLAVFLDGGLITDPVINEAITGGEALITGDFTPEEARAIVSNLNFGALPLPIALSSSETIGATLGSETVEKGVWAGIFGFAVVCAFMLLWYRFPGVVAVAALVSYVIFMLVLFQFIPVTLTAAGIAGFVLTIGMAVDANVIIFERLKEERRKQENIQDAITMAFSRAWIAIRDSNMTTLIAAIALYWMGTSLIKGFALTFGIGIIVSMFTAMTVTRVYIKSIAFTPKNAKIRDFLFGAGIWKN